MSRRQHEKLDAIARFLPDGEHKFLRALVKYANDDGAGAFPRRKTLVKQTGKSRRWLEVLERRLVNRGWIQTLVVGSGSARRTFYRVKLPPASAFQWLQLQRPRVGKQLRLPLEPVQNAAEILTTSADGDRIECDPGIAFALRGSYLSPSIEGGLEACSDSDPKNLDLKNVQKKERPPLARRHSPLLSSLDLGRLHVAKAHLKARLEAARERRRIAKLRRSR